MVENVSAELIAGMLFILGVWWSKPIWWQARPTAKALLCKTVPGGTPDDMWFYWNHWIVRLVVGLAAVGVGIVLWEHQTGGEVALVWQRIGGTILLAGILALCWAKWRQLRNT